jgi:hypothetical protein
VDYSPDLFKRQEIWVSSCVGEESSMSSLANHISCSLGGLFSNPLANVWRHSVRIREKITEEYTSKILLARSASKHETK